MLSNIQVASTLQTELSCDELKATSPASHYESLEDSANMGKFKDVDLRRDQFSRTMHYKNYKKMHTETARHASVANRLYASRVNENVKHAQKITPIE